MPVISITVSEEEEKKMRQRAEEELRSLSSYIRWCTAKDWAQAHPAETQPEPED